MSTIQKMVTGRKGLSGILATVLVVLLAIVAIAIVWFFVRSSITQAGQTLTDDVSFTGVTFSIVPRSAYVSVDNNVSFIIRRESGGGNITGVLVIIRDRAGNTYTWKNKSIVGLIKVYDTLPIQINGTEHHLSDVKSFLVYATIVNAQGTLVVSRQYVGRFVIPDSVAPHEEFVGSQYYPPESGSHSGGGGGGNPPNTPSCGALGEACCTSGTQCTGSLVCQGSVCQNPPPSCGNVGESCCAGTTCNSNFFCNAGQCETLCTNAQCTTNQECNPQTNRCDAIRGRVQWLTEPTTGAKFALYYPNGTMPTNQLPVIVSLHGTPAANATNEMDSSTFYNNGGFDWGGPSWPQLAENRTLTSNGFVVITPQLSFSGSNYSVCANYYEEVRTLAILHYLNHTLNQTKEKDIYVTGHSSGASLAFSFGMRRPEIFTQTVDRHGFLENVATTDYGENKIRAYHPTYNATGGCNQIDTYPLVEPPTGPPYYDWKKSPELHRNYMLVITGDAEPPGDAGTATSYHNLTQSSLREYFALPLINGMNFSRIRWRTFPSMGDNPFVCTVTSNPFYPNGCHAESREIAVQFFFGNKTVQGDIDDDGDADCTDFALLQQCMSGALNKAACDLTNDGIYDDSDEAVMNGITTVDLKQEWQYLTSPPQHVSC